MIVHSKLHCTYVVPLELMMNIIVIEVERLHYIARASAVAAAAAAADLLIIASRSMIESR